MIIDIYVSSSTQQPLCDFVRDKIKYVIKTNSWEIDGEEKFNYKVGYIVKNAKNGSEEARKKLIEYYMYIVDYFLLKYDLKIDYDDARQLGYLFLTQKINDYLSYDKKSYISTYLLHAFNSTFTSIISKYNQQEVEYWHVKKSCAKQQEDIYDDELAKFEFFDYIEKQDISDEDKFIFYQLFNQQSATDLANDLQISKTSIYNKNNKTKQKVKSFFEI